MQNISEKALDQRARRAARRVGLLARKSRWRANSIDNLGGFQIVDPSNNFIVDGSRFDLSATDVMAYSSDDIIGPSEKKRRRHASNLLIRKWKEDEWREPPPPIARPALQIF
jgi:hypothetical protein